MTDAYWVRDLLEEEWDRSRNPIPGEGNIRAQVPFKPEFILNGSRERRASHVNNQALVWLNDEGTPVRTPQSVGYTDERVEDEVSYEVVVPGNRQDIAGTVDARYGGVAGEVRRIIQRHRTGLRDDVSVPDPCYDIIEYQSLRDESGRRGGGIWTVEGTIRFITFAEPIIA